MKGNINMKFSTAIWISGILGSISIVAIATYFILDAKNMMFPFLLLIIKPLLTITMVPVIILLAAMLMASSKQEKQITRQSFKRAGMLLGALLLYKVFTGYFSK